MHLGLIGPLGHDLFAENIRDSLVRMGIRVSHLGSTRMGRLGRLSSRTGELLCTAFPRWEARWHSRLGRAAIARDCDAVLVTEATLAPEAVVMMRRAKIPVALWFPDYVGNFGRQQMLLAPYTALFLKDPLLVQRLRATLEAPVWYLPEACNPRWHRPVGEAGVERAIAVVGNTYPSRLMLLRRLHRAGIPLVIYGGAIPRWSRNVVPPQLHTGKVVLGQAKSHVFRTAAGVLNNLHPGEQGMNCRLFEATAAGGAVLCERRPALAELFDTDREVVPFTDVRELIDRIHELLADPMLTRDIGDAAAKRAHAEHTYDIRLATILERLS